MWSGVARYANPLGVTENIRLGDAVGTVLTGLTGLVVSPLDPYKLGTDQLSLYRNGVELLNSLTLGDAIQRYQETSTTSITLEVAAVASDVFVGVEDPEVLAVSQIDGVTGTTLTVPTYTLGKKHLLVHRNGLLMANSLTVGDPIEQYQEATTTTITLQTAAVADDEFRVERCKDNVAIEEIGGQTGTTITTATPIEAGDGNLYIYRNGALLVETASVGEPIERYTVTGGNQFTVPVAAVAADRFTVVKRDL